MKRSAIKRRPMADTVLEKLEAESKEYREFDSQGLYFRVKPTGKKSWDLRYKRPNGKWAWKQIGGYPALGGKEAREEALRLLTQSEKGDDLAAPEPVPAVNETMPTFREYAEKWYDKKVAEKLSPKTLGAYRLILDKDVYPKIGDCLLDAITPKQLVEIQETIEGRTTVGARKYRGIMKDIFSRTVALEIREYNPASDLKSVAKKAPKVSNHPFLLEHELPDFLKKLPLVSGRPISRIATFMVLLTAARPGMVRTAEWSDVDLENALWTIPGEKMKKENSLVVPLSSQLVDSLKILREQTGDCQYLFPASWSKKDRETGECSEVLSHGTINAVLRRVGYKGRLVGHGARHTASTLLHEHGWRPDYVEMMLAHVIKGVAGVYNHARYLKPRRVMMQWYADYLDALKDGTTEEREEEFASQVIR